MLDTISSLYRSLLGSSEEVFVQHRELNRQLAYLAELASIRHVAVLLMSQVHAQPLRQGPQIEPVAKRILTYWSEVVLRLSPTRDSSIKSAQLEHHYLPNAPLSSCLLRITERGFEKAEK